MQDDVLNILAKEFETLLKLIYEPELSVVLSFHKRGHINSWRKSQSHDDYFNCAIKVAPTAKWARHIFPFTRTSDLLGTIEEARIDHSGIIVYSNGHGVSKHYHIEDPKSIAQALSNIWYNIDIYLESVYASMNSVNSIDRTIKLPYNVADLKTVLLENRKLFGLRHKGIEL